MKFYVKAVSYKKPSGNRFFVSAYLKFNYLVLTLASLLSSTVFAQESYDQKDVLQIINLQMAIAKTIDRHPELRSFTNKSEVYIGYAQQAGIQSRPKIEFSIEDALGTGKHSGFKSAQSTISISWLLDGKLAKSKMASATIYGSTVALSRQIKALDLAAQTAKYFIQVLVNKERLTLAKFSLRQAKNSFKAIEDRVKAGKSSLIDKLTSQAEVVKRELVVEELTHEVDAIKYQLLAQWGGQEQQGQKNNQNENIRVIGSLLTLPQISLENGADFDILLNKLKQNPSVSLFATKQRIAQSQIELARIEAKPLWQFSTGLRRYETTDDFGLVAGISIPFGGTNQNDGKIKALRASQRQLEAESFALVQQLNTQLYVLIEQMKHSQHVIYSVTEKIIPVLEQAFLEAEKAYKMGLYSYTEWMSTQQALLNAQAELIEAYQSAHLNNIEIERLTGASLFTINKASNAPFNAHFNEKSNEK